MNFPFPETGFWWWAGLKCCRMLQMRNNYLWRSDRAPKMSGGVGTWRYMVPEVVRYEQYDEKIDIFAFSLILYFIFSGTQCLWAFWAVHHAAGRFALWPAAALLFDPQPLDRAWHSCSIRLYRERRVRVTKAIPFLWEGSQSRLASLLQRPGDWWFWYVWVVRCLYTKTTTSPSTP